jgi:hypothetical protein
MSDYVAREEAICDHWSNTYEVPHCQEKNYP